MEGRRLRTWRFDRDVQDTDWKRTCQLQQILRTGRCHQRTQRSLVEIIQTKMSYNSHWQNFSLRIANEWNKLPQDVVGACTVNWHVQEQAESTLVRYGHYNLTGYKAHQNQPQVSPSRTSTSTKIGKLEIQRGIKNMCPRLWVHTPPMKVLYSSRIRSHFSQPAQHTVFTCILKCMFILIKQPKLYPVS